MSLKSLNLILITFDHVIWHLTTLTLVDKLTLTICELFQRLTTTRPHIFRYMYRKWHEKDIKQNHKQKSGKLFLLFHKQFSYFGLTPAPANFISSNLSKNAPHRNYVGGVHSQQLHFSNEWMLSGFEYIWKCDRYLVPWRDSHTHKQLLSETELIFLCQWQLR